MENIGKNTTPTPSINIAVNENNWEIAFRLADEGNLSAQSLLREAFFSETQFNRQLISHCITHGATSICPSAYIAVLLGAMYFNGRVGNQECNKEPDKALHYFKYASGLKNVEADYLLGKMYCSGYGTSPNETINPELAITHFEKAHAGGNSKAAQALGEMYYDGKGVEQNFHTALEYYQEAQWLGLGGLDEKIATLELHLQQAHQAHLAYLAHLRPMENQEVNYFV